jgi:hypothetical protein
VVPEPSLTVGRNPRIGSHNNKNNNNNNNDNNKNANNKGTVVRKA